MRKYFTSGLAILLPVILTVVIVSFLINFLTRPFIASTQSFLETFPFFQNSFLFLPSGALIAISSKILILIFLSGFILLFGLFGRIFLVDTLLAAGEYLLHRLPMINKIYKASQDIVQSVFSSSSKKFSQVVFVPFPSPENLCIGLITGDEINLKNSQENSEKLISVFVPGTPNPSVGFMLMFKREQLIFVNMKVDEAMKFIVSCGIVMPDFEIVQPRETDENSPIPKDHLLPSEGQQGKDPLDLHQSA